MNFIRLNRLYGRAFRGLVEPFSIVFPESGLFLIKGWNQNTNDSSDSGKSSVLLAIAHLFGGCPYPSTQLQSFFTDEQYLVGAELQIGDKKVVVERSKGLTVKVDDEKPVKGKEAEALLDRLFGMDSATRSLVTYRGQGQPGLFLSMADQEKKGFLSKLLGLLLYEKIADEAAQKATLLEANMNRLSFDVTMHKNNLQTFEEEFQSQSEDALNDEIRVLNTEIQKYKEIVKDLAKEFYVHKESSESIGKDLDEALGTVRSGFKAKLKELLTNAPTVQEKLNGVRAQLEQLRSADRAEESKHNKEVAAIKMAGQACVTRVKAGKEAADRLMGLIRDKQQLDESLCFTCNRPWQSDAISVQVQILGPKIKQCSLAVNDGEQAESEIVELKEKLKSMVWESNPEILKLEETATSLQKEIQKQKDHERSLMVNNDALEKAELDTVKNQYAFKLHPLSNAMELIESKVGEHRNLIKDLELKVGILTSKLEGVGASKKRHEALIAKAADAVKQYEEVLLQYNAEKDLAELVGRKGFLGLIFDDVLSEAASAVNEILSNVANVRHVSFEFESEKESKNGNVQTRIIPTVTVHGDRRPMDSALSGGMKTAVQLAVDLGIGKIASHRCDSYPGWLILDESFDGLGKNSKESAIEMLQEYAKDRLVLIVDHSSEFQSLFADTIQMTSLDGRVKVSS